MSTKEKFKMKDNFTMLTLLTIPIAVAVNVVGSQIHRALSLPIYLDTIGTIFTGILCGPWVAAITGLITNCVNGITNPVALAFIPTSVILGLVAGFLAIHKMYSNWKKLIVSLIILALTSTIVSAPISVYMFGGITGNGASIIEATLMTAGVNIWKAVIGTEFIITLLDRSIAVIISFLIIKVVPNRTLVKYRLGMTYIREEEIEDEEEDNLSNL
jgi:energy-coupling factor transport system substrate-specific component